VWVQSEGWAGAVRLDDVAQDEPLVERMRAFGTTIFAEMSALALTTDSVNLGQGFPDTDGPQEILDAAVDALRGGQNQYPPGPGIPALRQAISEHQSRRYGLDYDPDTEVLVTAGAERRTVTIERDGTGWGFDAAGLERAIGPATKILLLNSPHNPTGTVFGPAELAAVADAAIRHDLVVISDEVYEHLTFDGRRHTPIATLPGMRERTVTISSAGKTFSVTGWKVGWACAPPPLLSAVRTVKQFLTYVNGAPFQPAVARVLASAEKLAPADALQAQRDLLCDGLAGLGFDVIRPQATYFATVDVGTNAVAYCRELPQRAGVVAVPSSVFYDSAAGDHYVRFAFCKRPEVLAEALRRLKGATA
jgi:N-succinyldiaminopimelate aminotransferase